MKSVVCCSYKWVSAFCPTAQYILKTDDDIYADIFQVIDVLLVELMNSNKTYCCENMGGNKPIRVTNSKWYVPKELYPEDTYPDFCSGSAYLMKAADASKIYSVSNATDFFWIDDVFVTGVLREKYGTIVNNGSTTLEILSVFNRHHLGDKKEITKWCTKDLRTSQLNYTFILLNKNEFIRDMFCIWNKVRLMRHAMNVALA